MRSPHALTPHVVVNRTPVGFIVVCTCGFTAEVDEHPDTPTKGYACCEIALDCLDKHEPVEVVTTVLPCDQCHADGGWECTACGHLRSPWEFLPPAIGGGEIRQRLEDLAGSANESELRWRLGEWLTDLRDADLTAGDHTRGHGTPIGEQE